MLQLGGRRCAIARPRSERISEAASTLAEGFCRFPPQVRESAPGGRKAQSAASGALGAEATPEGREDNHAGVC